MDADTKKTTPTSPRLLPFLTSGPELWEWPDCWVSVEFLHAPVPRKGSGSTTTTTVNFQFLMKNSSAITAVSCICAITINCAILHRVQQFHLTQKFPNFNLNNKTKAFFHAADLFISMQALFHWPMIFILRSVQI